MDNGWIKLHRSIQSHWIYQDAKKLKWWFDMLFMANWEDKKVLVGNTLVTIKRGQLMASNSFFVEKWCVCSSTVRNFLQLLEADNMITQTAYPKYNVITICNYDKYQVAGETPVDPYAEVKADPKTYPNADPNTHPKADPNKEYKEYKESKERKNNITSSPARAREEELALGGVIGEVESLAEELKKEILNGGTVSESAMRLYGLNPQQQVEYLGWFVDKLRLDGTTFKSRSDFRRHFSNWLRIQVEQSLKRQQNGTTKYSSRTENPADLFAEFG